MTRKIILNLAISLDGFIAREDGSFDWIKGDGSKVCDTKDEFDFDDFLKGVDIVVMGRKSWEDAPEEGRAMFEGKKVCVVSHRDIENCPENVEVISGDVVEVVAKMQEEDGGDVWLYGGGEIVDYFVKTDVVDEYIVGIVPVLLGKGRPLFLGGSDELRLKLKSLSSKDGIVIMKYSRK